jgi:DNA polymerase-3 subunit delta
VAKKGIDVGELARKLGSGGPGPVYLVVGEEAALRRRALELLQKPFLGPRGELEPGTFARLDADSLRLDEILDEARTLPLFAMMADGPSRLLWVGGFDRMDTDPDSIRPLVEYLEDPVSATCLVFEAATVDKRRGVYKALAKHAEIVVCDPPQNEAEVRSWIERTVEGRGYRIDRDAVVLLTEMAGTGMSALEHELEKAMLFVGERGGAISARDLEGLLGRTRERSVFELTDALVAREPREAQRLLNLLIDDGEEPIRLLAMVAWITRQLVTAYDLAREDLPEKEKMQQLGGRWNQRRELLQRSRRSTRDGLLDALRACGEADLTIKRLRDGRPGADRTRPARGTLEALCRQICAA